MHLKKHEMHLMKHEMTAYAYNVVAHFVMRAIAIWGVWLVQSHPHNMTVIGYVYCQEASIAQAILIDSNKFICDHIILL